MISEEHTAMLDDLISLEEIVDAVKKLKLNTSPGLDGLTPEFCKKIR